MNHWWRIGIAIRWATSRTGSAPPSSRPRQLRLPPSKGSSRRPHSPPKSNSWRPLPPKSSPSRNVSQLATMKESNSKCWSTTQATPPRLSSINNDCRRRWQRPAERPATRRRKPPLSRRLKCKRTMCRPTKRTMAVYAWKSWFLKIEWITVTVKIKQQKRTIKIDQW